MDGRSILKVTLMSRRSSNFRQRDIARIIRAAKQTGASEVELRIDGAYVVIRLAPSTEQDSEPEAIVL